MHRSIGLLVIGLVVASAFTLPAAAQTDTPELTVAWANEDHSRALISLSAAPDGLTGYTIEIAVNDSSSATISGFEQVTKLGPLTDFTVAEDGRSATAKVADTSHTVQNGTGSVDLVFVDLEGVSDSPTPPITITATELTTDSGDAMDVTVRYETAALEAETLTKQPTQTTSTGGPAPGALAALIALGGSVAIANRS